MSPELLQALEPEQISTQRYLPYPRRHWGLGVQVLLWVLRLYVAVAVPLVFYAFWHALRAG